MIANMKAELLAEERIQLTEDVRIELILWNVPTPVRGSLHSYKYRMVLIDSGACVLRYDNEAGKGDHKHVGQKELPYVFSSVDVLRRDFMADVMKYMGEKK